jgi:hypothetical protein
MTDDLFGDGRAWVKAPGGSGENDNRSQVSPVGVPARGRLRPTRHEQAILRRLAQPGAYAYVEAVEREDDSNVVAYDFALGTRRHDYDIVFCYESGEVIRDYYSHPMGPDEFWFLQQWLTRIEPLSEADDDAGIRWIARTTTEPDFVVLDDQLWRRVR